MEFDAERFAKLYRLVPVCPEQLGGLPTPRTPSEIVGGTGADVLDGRARVVTRGEVDVSANFIRGAQACVRIAEVTRATCAVLQSRSPSCGCLEIHAGKFDGIFTTGMGVAATGLSRAGIIVFDASSIAGSERVLRLNSERYGK